MHRAPSHPRFLGWLLAPPRPESPAAGLEALASGSPPSLVPVEPAGSRGLYAAVQGEVRWRDAALAAIARADGQAAALVRAYERDGADLARFLGGHFAVALVDPQRRFALLATDRMGTRPWRWTLTSDGGFVFASSLDELRRHAAVRARLSAQALYDYVYFHMIPGPGTVYAGIHKVERASIVTFDGGTLTTRAYWTPAFAADAHASTDALAAELRATLRDAVARCAPDESTASFLSGGLDSSTVCGVHRELAGTATRAYTIGFDAEGYDEMGYARIAAARFGLDLREHYVTADDIAASMRDVAHAYEEPFGNSSAVPTLACARRARADGVRTMLAGDGGDEIFAGNERYARQSVFEYYWRLPGWLRAGVVEPLVLGLPVTRWTPPSRKLRSYVEQARVPMPVRLETYNFVHRMTPQALFTPEFLARVDTGHPPALLEASYTAAPAGSLVDRMMYLDWKITLADNDLRKVGRMCELAGIDVRYPMLDDALVDFSLRVPPGLKLKTRDLRHFYKRALADFLPREIIAKRKHGFGLPFGVWLTGSPELQGLVYGSLDALKRRGIFLPEFLDRLVASQRDEHAAYYGDLVWVLAMLELWLAEHGESLP
jgi:asparagine synthase (glutamine-hydrolysing)